MNNIVLHNAGSRFGNAELFKPGQFVLTDDWTIHGSLGESFESLLMNVRGKAIEVDYMKKTVEKTYDVEGELWNRVVKKSAGKYNKDYGYYWGIELILWLREDGGSAAGDEYTFFACTDATRQSIQGVYGGQQLVFKSELIKGKRFDFYKPVITLMPN